MAVRKLKNYKTTLFMEPSPNKRESRRLRLPLQRSYAIHKEWAGKQFELIDWRSRRRDLFGVIKETATGVQDA